MSDILIRGMEIPKEFDPNVYIELACGIDGKNYARLYNFHYGGLSEWCEVIPVPPHGDLIDRRALEKAVFDGRYQKVFLHDCPIIIPADPAEEGET